MNKVSYQPISSTIKKIFLYLAATPDRHTHIKKSKRSEIIVGVDGEKGIFT